MNQKFAHRWPALVRPVEDVDACSRFFLQRGHLPAITNRNAQILFLTTPLSGIILYQIRKIRRQHFVVFVRMTQKKALSESCPNRE